MVRAEGLSIDVALAAAPVEGAANEELVSVLAEVLGVPRRGLRLVLGAGSKSKVVEVDGLDEEAVIRKLAEAARGSSR